MLKYQFSLWLQEKNSAGLSLYKWKSCLFTIQGMRPWRKMKPTQLWSARSLWFPAQWVTDAEVGMCPLWHEPDSRSLLTLCTRSTLLALPYWMDSYLMHTLKTSRRYSICNLHSFSFSFSQRKLVLVIIFITKNAETTAWRSFSKQRSQVQNLQVWL